VAKNYEKPDFWSLKARKEGYPARSVYKLKEMDEKFRLLRPGPAFRALDLGAAPGSWSLYVLKRLGGAGFLAAADLSPLSTTFGREEFSGRNFFFVQGDLTAHETQAALSSRGPFSLLLCDAAPATSGNRALDAPRSLALAEAALDYAAFLAPGGSLAVKVFQGPGVEDLLARLKNLFETGRTYKPTACRSESFETYLIGLGKKNGCIA